MIIGITGRKGVGKDSFAAYVREYEPNSTILKFADSLKAMATKIFGFTAESMENLEAKERLFETPLDMDSWLPDMSILTGLPLTKKGLKANSIRQVLQFLGSDYVRAVCQSYWTDRLIADVKQCTNLVLVTDCRFENEADAIRAIGGKIIKIDRLDMEKPENSHMSESSIDKIVPDLIIGTLTGKFDVQKKVAALVAAGDQRLWEKL